MNPAFKRVLATTLVAVFCSTAAFAFPAPAAASHRTQDGETSFEGFVRLSSSMRRKINNLDDDPVRNIPIPILFGVKVSDLFPNFADPRSGGRTHEGQDILAPLGTPVVSPTDAVVTSIGAGARSGNYVYTANPGGETFRYMHLDEVADGLDRGDVLEPGGLIGFVGDTGNAAGGPAHLHLEIRKDGATDPFPRLTTVFDLEDKMEFLEEILEDADEEEGLAEFLVKNYAGEFALARTQKIDLPEAIEDALGATNAITPTATALPSMPIVNLYAGTSGSAVVWLQNFLITRSSGPAAARLALAGATGYFGPITQAALAEYQSSQGIVPAIGYFGVITRAHIAASG